MLRATLKCTAMILHLSCCGLSTGYALETITLAPRVIPVGKWAEGVVFDGTSLWVVESGEGTIAQLEPDKGNVIRRISVGRRPVGMTFAKDGAIYTLVRTDKLLWQQFPKVAQGKALTDLAGCPAGLASSDKFLWVLTGPDCSSNSGRVIRVDPRGGDRSSAEILGNGQAVTAYRGEVLVAHFRGPSLSIIDEQSMAVRTANVNGSLWAITARGRNVYVGGVVSEGSAKGMVASVNPSTFQELRRHIVDQRIVVMVDDDKSVVAVGEKGKIWVFSADGFELQRFITLTTGSFEPKAALIRGENLYLSSGRQQGENGAVLIVAGWRPGAAPAPPPGQLR
jgi:DNA-binding beta-propeller fold protein YncE